MTSERGGVHAEPPFEIRNRAELVDALSVAAHFAHVVLVEDLYAAFSLAAIP